MFKTNCPSHTDDDGRELNFHGTLAYPLACYQHDMTKSLVIWHWHQELEVIIAHKGTIKVGAGQNELTINEGDGCFINSSVGHNVLHNEGNEGFLKSIVFHHKLIGGQDSIYWQKYIRPLIEDKQKQFIFFDSNRAKDKKIISLIKDAWQAESEEKSGFEFEVRALLSQLIFLISEEEIGKPYTPTRRELRDMERTKLMITFMENNFTEDVTLQQISDVASISESECLRCFKRSTGISPIQFLKEYRILKAAELIRATNLKISSIAEQCGFFDMSYFAKSFRQIFRDSPTNYRKLIG